MDKLRVIIKRKRGSRENNEFQIEDYELDGEGYYPIGGEYNMSEDKIIEDIILNGSSIYKTINPIDNTFTDVSVKRNSKNPSPIDESYIKGLRDITKDVSLESKTTNSKEDNLSRLPTYS